MAAANIDVDWLLHSKTLSSKADGAQHKDEFPSTPTLPHQHQHQLQQSSTELVQPASSTAETSPPAETLNAGSGSQPPDARPHHHHLHQPPTSPSSASLSPPVLSPTAAAASPPTTTAAAAATTTTLPKSSSSVRPPPFPRKANDSSPTLRSSPGSQKRERESRRSSWISSLSSKFGGSDLKRHHSVDSTSSNTNSSSAATTTATSTATATATSTSSTTTTTMTTMTTTTTTTPTAYNHNNTQKGSLVRPTTDIEFTNSFDLGLGRKGGPTTTGDKKEDSKKPVVVGPTIPYRRQTVLVAAGKETKLDNPGFLSSALRRLSSSHANMAKGVNHGAICPRKVMNIDQNRPRIKIAEFDQSKLKRVAFCVDVEIAGFAAHGDDDSSENLAPPPTTGPGARPARASLSAASTKPDSKDAQLQHNKGEGGSAANAAQQAQDGEKPTGSDPQSEAQSEAAAAAAAKPPMTRKKEKKKRSEAERKERKERKRRHAEENGLVPLELTRDLNEDDDESDSSPNSTPPGASTPSRSFASPTTDPLRIYKRCCQLRETTVLNKVKEQISEPAATLAEAPGTVAVVDLSGTKMQLQDIVTLGDWLAVVPVRKLVLNDCNLSDEAIRVILSGLASCKSSEQFRANRKLPKRLSGRSGLEQMGVIEKLSLKDNPALTDIGWGHIALFLHLSSSIKAIDLSGIPFPKPRPNAVDLKRTTPVAGRSRSTTSASAGGGGAGGAAAAYAATTANGSALPHSNQANEPHETTSKIGGNLFFRAISERLGDKLEELILSNCTLSAQNISDMVDAAIKTKICRLGLASNNLDEAALVHVVRYLKSGVCEGLDLGGNDLHGSCHLTADALEENNPLFAISFADCGLDPVDLAKILKPMGQLKNLKFIDLSQNPNLFAGHDNNAVAIFRKFLPKLKELKRFHLADCGLSSDHVIAIAEILPDCPSLCHISVLDNSPLVKAMNSKDEASQEEACAFFASLMTAVRVSTTIIAIEIEVPSTEASEVVKALASQVVAYSLRNMERGVQEFGVKSNDMPDKDAPEVLLHLVGHMDGYSENHDRDEPAPDQDYVIASTGIVKALAVFLRSREASSRAHSRTQTPRNASPSQSGTSTPRHGLSAAAASAAAPLRPKPPKKPRDVSLELCEGARKIRMRLRPALIKEDRDGNDVNYRRLLSLDQTLQRMIQRFEDEYPETKVSSLPQPITIIVNAKADDADANNKTEPDTVASSVANESILSTSTTTVDDSNSLISGGAGAGQGSASAATAGADDSAIKLSRTPSTTSLAAKEYTIEEGRMLRFGQTLRREVLKPTGITDHLHGVHQDDIEPEHLAKLRARLEALNGDEIRQQVLRDGLQKVIGDLGVTARELALLKEQDPVSFENFKGDQLVSQLFDLDHVDVDGNTGTTGGGGGGGGGVTSTPATTT